MVPPAEAMLAFGRTILAAQNVASSSAPSVPACDGTTVELTTPMRDELKQQHGFI